MKVIVPLAGPGFEIAGGLVKSQMPVNGMPLLRAALEGRPWWRNGAVSDADLVFVLRDTARSRSFMEGELRKWYPRSKSVSISHETRGAALSSLAGVSVIAEAEGPLCIDLVDILYECSFDPLKSLSAGSVSGAALVFDSDSPSYSYLRLDERGHVVEAAEKRVISNLATAGTYFFSSVPIFLGALAHNLQNKEAVTFNSLFFVCPLLNGVIALGGTVIVDHVTGVHDLKQSS